MLPVREGVSDTRQVDLVFSRAGVRTLGDVIVVDPTRETNVVAAAHAPGHVVARASYHKEDDCSKCDCLLIGYLIFFGSVLYIYKCKFMEHLFLSRTHFALDSDLRSKLVIPNLSKCSPSLLNSALQARPLLNSSNHPSESIILCFAYHRSLMMVWPILIGSDQTK